MPVLVHTSVSVRKMLPVFMAGFAFIGVVTLLSTRAASPQGSVVVEGENSQRTGLIVLKNDANASGNSYVEFGAEPPANTASQLTQRGITFQFDQNYQYGQFANGDYWVVGPVTITSISPDTTVVNTGNATTSGTFHGWLANPVPYGGHSFDSRIQSYNASLQPSFPYTAQPNTSVLKSVSLSTCEEYAPGPAGRKVCVDKVMVLTVLSSIPPDNGATVFRPPYSGTSKPLFSTASLRTDLLPSYAPPSGGLPSGSDMTTLSGRFDAVHLELGAPGLVNRSLHPVSHMFNYPPDNAVTRNTAISRLLLNDPIANKMPLLIRVVQAGIDAHFDVVNGQDWSDGGGYQVGHKMLDVFTAVMLDDADMKSRIAGWTNDNDLYQEDYGIYRSSVTGKALFGYPRPGSDKTTKDPHEYIDGGVDYTGPGTSYQYCCITQPHKGAVLIGLMMPELQAVWGQTEFDVLTEYIDRWVTFGAWALPDPYNRWPQNHGINPDGGHRRSALIDALWPQYREGL